jgi:hypothetical protein
MEVNSVERRFHFSLRWLLLVVPIAAILLGVTIRWIQRESDRGWSVERLERSIQAEVPPIQNRQQAEAWFKANSIDCQYFDDPTGGYEVGNQTAAMLAGLQSKNLSGVVRGSIEGEAANVGFLSNGRIIVFFFFDHQGRCVGHFIHPFEYSL